MYAGQQSPSGAMPGGLRNLNPSVMPWLGAGDIDALTESKSFEVTALNQTFTDIFTVPDGYSKVVPMIFDPTVGSFISLKSQRAKQDILLDFSTLGAGIGIIPLGTKNLQDDVLVYTMNFSSQGRISAAIWNGATSVQFPENPLPYKHTLTLIYGR